MRNVGDVIYDTENTTDEAMWAEADRLYYQECHFWSCMDDTAEWFGSTMSSRRLLSWLGSGYHPEDFPPFFMIEEEMRNHVGVECCGQVGDPTQGRAWRVVDPFLYEAWRINADLLDVGEMPLYYDYNPDIFVDD